MTNETTEAELEYSNEDEWDDTPTTMQLRALFTLLAGSVLLWSQVKAPLRPDAEWNRFIALSIVANLLLPLGIVWMFFAQGVRRVEWLQNQALNAWNYGWDFRDWKSHLKWSLAMFAVLLPLIFWASRQTAARDYYAGYFPRDANIVWLTLTLVVYMFCWEWFFRGFLLFGIAQGVGPIVAIVVQAALFGMAHIGKPQPEFYASFIGGAILGIVAWRQKSFAAPFYTHALLHVAWLLLMRL